uniref:ATP-dependent DNA helicase n=1 Tax=Salix viminalis TaxID=40686 RepID=A0A6N2MX53_SALVM
MHDDILHKLRTSFRMLNLILSDDQLKDYLLYELEHLFNASAATLQDHNLSMPVGKLLKEITNKLLREELNYDLIELKSQHSLDFTSLNHGQIVIYDSANAPLFDKKQALIFVHGHGGTGKTFLWHTIINRIRSKGLIVLVVASFGIASLLLPNGCTSHSRFNSHLLLMSHQHVPLRKTLIFPTFFQKSSLIPLIIQCVMFFRRVSTVAKISHLVEKQFYLLLIFFQILLFIPCGTKEQIINASLTSSTLWSKFTVLTLIENMHLFTNGLTSKEKADISEFSEWILSVGNDDISDLPSLSESDDLQLLNNYPNISDAHVV